MKKTLLTLALSLATTSAFATNWELTKSLQEKFPNTKITSADYVVEIPGLVELIIDKNKIIYTNKEGSHFVIGHVFDARNNADVTQLRIDSLSTYSYSDLPFKDAVKVVKGDGSREFAVFSDPTCPYCKKLEKELVKLDNYTMYVFPSAFHASGRTMMGRILCEKDPGKAWVDWMAKGIEPNSKGQCHTDKIQRALSLANKIGVSGTPALLSKTGKIAPGYVPAPQLNLWLNTHSK
ncbi:DsbC family protein [Thiomicrorhabdus hydrogeniphila]